MNSPKRQDKFETNLMIKRKQKEQKLGIYEHIYKTGEGSGARDHQVTIGPLPKLSPG